MISRWTPKQIDNREPTRSQLAPRSRIVDGRQLTPHHRSRRVRRLIFEKRHRLSPRYASQLVERRGVWPQHEQREGKRDRPANNDGEQNWRVFGKPLGGPDGPVVIDDRGLVKSAGQQPAIAAVPQSQPN